MNNITKRAAAAAILLAAAASAGAVTPLWLRDVKISPDGSSIAFTYKGDIFTVPASGGTATRLTTAPSYESHPVWSPDSKKIAFASDREGGRDIFIMPASGGTATRLTFNSASELPEAFTPDGKEVVFSAAIQDPASSADFPTSRRGDMSCAEWHGWHRHSSPTRGLQFLLRRGRGSKRCSMMCRPGRIRRG